MIYALNDSIEVNGDTITEVILACDSKYRSTVQKIHACTLIYKLDKYIPQLLSRKYWYQS